MFEKIRLDKFLADLSVGTRSEVKNYIRKGRVTINGNIVKSADTKLMPSTDLVTFDGIKLIYASYEYYLLNKPAGVISAVYDKYTKTVIDLIDSAIRKDLFPVGRLDKDTEGLLLITNDGELAHRLLSPKKHVDKVYFARVRGIVTKEDIKLFEQGLIVEEGFMAMPSRLVILKIIEDYSEVELTIREGKFHQVKRMFEAVSKEVVYLKRIAMGTLTLPDNLASGDYRKLTKEEINILKSVF